MTAHSWRVALPVALIVSGATAVAAVQARPGTEVRSLTFPSQGAVLVADLHLPPGATRPMPAVVFVHGSERMPRDRYRAFAERFAPRGIATLIFDKRGVGESSGSFQNLTATNSETLLRQLAGDVRNAAIALARQPDIDPTRVGLFGGSQAGWVMPLAAQSGPPVTFIVTLSGPAVSVGLEIFHGRISRERDQAGPPMPADELRRRLAAFTGAAGYDPLPTLRALPVPSLWLMGGRDRNLPLEQSVANLESLQEASGGRLSLKLFADADHQLARPDGSRVDYVAEIASWLTQLGVLR